MVHSAFLSPDTGRRGGWGVGGGGALEAADEDISQPGVCIQHIFSAII